jgi:hypothetical protein
MASGNAPRCCHNDGATGSTSRAACDCRRDGAATPGTRA